jgi:lysophospholipid acyltransferase (LPLAT)-like uncharacterized protein
VPTAVAWLMRIWFASCKVIVHNQENLFHAAAKDKTAIASFWHYSIVYSLYHLRHYSATVMVSASRDGEYIARLAEKFGYDTVRGSKNKKGFEGLKAMLRAIGNGSNGGIVADGSQGPARVLQAGVILLASRTGVPIIPMICAASSYFTVNSWDRTIIPKPFSHVDFYYGQPFWVPAKLTPAELEEYRLGLQERLNTLYDRAWRKYDKTGH